MKVGESPDFFTGLTGDEGRFDRLVVRKQGERRHLAGSPAQSPRPPQQVYFSPVPGGSFVFSAEVQTSQRGRTSAEMGLLADGFLLVLRDQKIILCSGPSGTAIHAFQPFFYEPEVWYSLKLRIQKPTQAKAVISVKVWPSSDSEPEQWSFSYTATNRRELGGLGLHIGSETAVYFDNLQAELVTP